jgi:hypothetical protein
VLVRACAECTSYVLHGENDALPSRVALPASADAETGYLLGIPNYEAGYQGATARTSSGYALMTTRGGLHTAWRVYGDIPPDQVLVRDFKDVLSGRLRPFLRWRNGQVTVIMPQTLSGGR